MNDTAHKIREFLEANRGKIDKIKTSLSKPFYGSYLEEKNYRKKLKSELKQVRKNIASAETLFENNSTFDCISLLTFLKNYLSLKEQEEYTLIGDSTHNFDTSSYTTIRTNTYRESYYIVTTSSNAENLINNEILSHCFQICDIDDFLSKCNDDKYICMEQKTNYSLLKKEKLNPIFKKYPYLEDAAYELVDLKIDHPEYTDEQRLNIVYSNLQKSKTKTLTR